jgi:hypothetical protein
VRKECEGAIVALENQRMSKRENPVAFSPGEFAALFGKSQTWGYRQIYAGKVNAITEYGRMLIPASEVERILATAVRYEGIRPKKAPQTKAQWQQIAPQLESAWQRFVKERRGSAREDAAAAASPAKEAGRRRQPQASGKERQAALNRLTGGRKPSS